MSHPAARLLLVGLVGLGGALACSAAEAARCDELISPSELQSVKRNDTLSRVDDSRGSSICMWEGPGGDGGFILTLQTADWFKFEEASGPKDSFDRKRKGYDAVAGTEPIPGVGLEARITKHEHAPTVMVRRNADIFYLMCTDCSRDQSIALAKLAASP
jgi:hypothetical protein